jgi:hypothetical protein
MANKVNSFLLAIIMLATIFAYSCGGGGSPIYYAKIAKADWILYASLYPNVTMEPGGYYLNEMARYGAYQYGEDICKYYIDHHLSEDERNLYISQAGGRDYAIDFCIMNNEQKSFSGESIKDSIKSANTPYYDAINREIFVRKNNEFLGFFYSVDEQLYYIYVLFYPGE